MAKRKSSRKRQKRELQEAAKRARWRNTGAVGPEFKFDVDLSAANPDLLADVRGAFEPGSVISPEAMSKLAIDSHHLFEEPELEGVLANPLLAVVSFVELADAAGVASSDIDLDEEGLAPLIFELTPYLLAEDPDLRHDLIDELEKLRARLKRQRRTTDAGRAAMTQLLLQHGGVSSWRLIGLVHRVVARSLFAGFSMSELGEEIEEATGTQMSDLRIDTFTDNIPEPLVELLEADPALRTYLGRKLDHMWQAGLKATINGELELSLFTSQEVDAAVEIMGPYVTFRDGEIDMDASGLRDSFQAMVERLLTPERQQQMDGAIKSFLATEEIGLEDQAFLKLVQEALSNDEDDKASTFRAQSFAWTALLRQALEAYYDQLQEEE